MQPPNVISKTHLVPKTGKIQHLSVSLSRLHFLIVASDTMAAGDVADLDVAPRTRSSCTVECGGVSAL